MADEVGGESRRPHPRCALVVFTLSSLLYGSLGLVVSGSPFGADNEIDDGESETLRSGWRS